MKHMLLDPALTRQFFVGFDPLLERFEKTLTTASDKYPPHNVVQVDDNRFQIVVAIAGFSKSDITISLEKDRLSIKGSREADTSVVYLYKGISNRSFSKDFILQDDVYVGAAKFEDGMLTINLERIVPIENKSRLISID